MSAELNDVVGNIQAELKSIVDERFEKLEKGQGIAEVEAKFDKGFKDWSEKQDALQKKIADIEAAVARKGDLGGESVDEKQVEQKSALLNYFRSGVEAKTMIRGDDNRGGYFVHDEMAQSIVEFMYETSPMDRVANVVNISSDAYTGVVDADDIDFFMADEQTTPARDDAHFRTYRIPVHVGGVTVLEAQQLLDDASIDLEGYLSRKAGERISRGQNAQFVNGSGVNRARGFTTYTDGTNWGEIEQIATGSATGLTADGVIELIFGLKDVYRRNATLVGSRTTLGDIMKLKDDRGAYLFDYTSANSPIVKGVPFLEFNDMEDTNTAGNLPLAIADWSRAYTVVRRSGVSVLRDPYSEKPLIEHTFSSRFGGDVVNFDAIKLQDVAAS